MNSQPPILHLAAVDTGYGSKKVLSNITMSVAPGSVIGLMGTNGAGKSTLLRLVAGFVPLWTGRLIYEECDISKVPVHERASLGIGFVMQGGQVFPSMSVSENLTFAKSVACSCSHNDADPFPTPFELFPELADLRNRRAGLLSGGERHMLAIAVVLIQRPRLLLLDEPFAGLAQDTAWEAGKRLVPYVRGGGCALVLVEQNPRIMIELCDTIHVMTQGTLSGTVERNDPDREEHLTNQLIPLL